MEGASGCVPRKLSAKFKEDFAYPTVKDRLPIILTKLIDSIARKRDCEKNDRQTDLKAIIGKLSKFRSFLMTNKPIEKLNDELPDVKVWNDYLLNQTVGNESPSHFTSSWLYVECYFYRKLAESFNMSTHFKDFDYFFESKQNAWFTSINAAESLAKHLLFVTSLDYKDEKYMYEHFEQFFEVALWGNKCDLSISAGAENTQTVDPIEQLSILRPNLLHNCKHDVWDYIWNYIRNKEEKKRIDFVLDNAGFELFSDLCLAEYLMLCTDVDIIYFHVKSYPWFVSDVTSKDVEWTVTQMVTSESDQLKELGSKWKDRFQSGQWKITIEAYWTLPYSFWEMEEVDMQLYANLTSSDLLIFKGDLNYRKLCRDSKWSILTDFDVAIGCFQPAPICALRTVKCDLLLGLTTEEAEKCDMQNREKWMFDGSRAVAHFSTKICLPFKPV
ncbi:DgyrCDS10503 [Dimorphilus gyrociliatus]|uniref:Sugar phosphate phosphatase n=1 Tax=Dimorphilus gyrociliatus TaxID=2664684 RepID=A0A7I8W0J8_9ANNE|nr:DgyrCDS10503 [Dimorphilus gyrociliatus]